MSICNDKKESILSDIVLLTDGSYCDKTEAHVKGSQHYAFSIFLFDSLGNLLIQKRANGKYHSGGLWSNTCCSHPLSVRSINGIEKEAKSRLFYEMGICDVSLNFEFLFSYNEQCSDYKENEVDYIFSCVSEQTPKVNEEEVSDFRWINIKTLKKEMQSSPEMFTIWFRQIMELHSDKLFKRELLENSCLQL